jgi:hypothetical protein
VGDSLEVQLFTKSGWRYCSRPTDRQSEARGWGLDESGVWRHPGLQGLAGPS